MAQLTASQVINSASSSIPTNALSAFSTTSVKPALGVTLTFTVDVELLLQDTGRVFGLADEGERERAGSAPGLRVLVEVLKSRSSVSCSHSNTNWCSLPEPGVWWRQ